MTAKKPTTIAEALLLAQRAMDGGIAKDATNQHHRYDYVSAESMIARCREVLLEVGLVLTAGDVLARPFSTAQADALIVEVGYRLHMAGSTDEVITLSRAWPAVPGKGRPIDKAVASAQTACLSYALRDLLLIPRGDEAGVGMDDTARDRQTAQATTSRLEQSVRADPQVREVSPRAFNGQTEPTCPACSSRVWDNRDTATEENRRPSWKCANKQCTGGRNGREWASWKADEFAAPPPPHVVADVDERGEQFTADAEIPF